ncbi:hypothetical protein M8J76_009251 [Diaphorina citri]|nr:hypothetical protein M8J76_009251 [Diaphorina citri]
MALQQCISSSYCCFSLRIGAIISAILLLCLIAAMIFIEITYMGGTTGLQRLGSHAKNLSVFWVCVTIVYLILLIILLVLPMSYIRKFLTMFTWVWTIFTLINLSNLVNMVFNLINHGWPRLTTNSPLSGLSTDLAYNLLGLLYNVNPINYLWVLLFVIFTSLSVYLAVILYSYFKQLKL